MTTVALTATPTQLDSGSSAQLYVRNSGATVVHVLTAHGDTQLRPGEDVTVQPAAAAVTAKTEAGNGQVDVTVIGADYTPAGGTTVAPELGDYAHWHRDTGKFVDTGSFDYVADLAESAGTSILADTGSDWVTSYGYPVAKVTKAGSYTLSVRVDGSSVTCGLNYFIMDANGDNITPWHGGGESYATNGSGLYSGARELTVYLPIGAHVEAGFHGEPDAALDLMIQRVA